MILKRVSLVLVAGVVLASPGLAEPKKINLLAMNMWGAGANADKPIDETLAVMKASGADIIAAVETVPEPKPCDAGVDKCLAGDQSRAADLAKALGYNFHEFKHNTETHWADAVISKYPFGKETPNGTGVEINVDGKIIVVYPMNLNDAPYQPYQLLNIAYGDAPFLKTAEEAVASAKATRGKALALISADVASESTAVAQFVMGDANEPSGKDWTQKAVAAGNQPLVVEWPFTKGLEDLGFVDSFRKIYPDEVAKPGMTWTPTTEASDKEDHHDRIDFIMVLGKTAKITSAGIVGEKAPEADLVVTPWPSDHRATMAAVELE
jgi:exodeoxyribonuclease-3